MILPRSDLKSMPISHTRLISHAFFFLGNNVGCYVVYRRSQTVRLIRQLRFLRWMRRNDLNKSVREKRVFASTFSSEFLITRSMYPRHSVGRFWKTTFLPIEFLFFLYSISSFYCFKYISWHFSLFIARSYRISSSLIVFTSFVIWSFHLAFFPLIHFFGSNVPSFLPAWPVHWKPFPQYLVQLFKFVVFIGFSILNFRKGLEILFNSFLSKIQSLFYLDFLF